MLVFHSLIPLVVITLSEVQISPLHALGVICQRIVQTDSIIINCLLVSCGSLKDFSLLWSLRSCTRRQCPVSFVRAVHKPTPSAGSACDEDWACGLLDIRY